MPFLAAWYMDVTLLLFVSLALYRHFIFRGDSQGLRWMVAGGLFFLTWSVLSSLTWSQYGLSEIAGLIQTLLQVIGSLLVVVGLFKTLSELFK